jgi:hypothetical protein
LAFQGLTDSLTDIDLALDLPSTQQTACLLNSLPMRPCLRIFINSFQDASDV